MIRCRGYGPISPGEKASEFDDAGWGHILFRPFKNYSGDISGRFIEIMAMNARGDYNVHPAFKELLAERRSSSVREAILPRPA